MNKWWLIALALTLIASPASAEGDRDAGERVFKKCQACHLIGDKTGRKTGPTLNDMFGRAAASVEDFKYSPAMIAKGEEGLVWTPENFAEYIDNPRKYVPRTKMAFAGVKKPEDVANLIAFLLEHSPDYNAEASAD